MKDGWLWLSILKMAASPSPISITPAFSPGPCSTHGAFVGRRRRCARVDLYEQCSLHITEKMPSSTRLGSRPSRLLTLSYSGSERPCSRTIWGVIEFMSPSVALRAPPPPSGGGKRGNVPDPFPPPLGGGGPKGRRGNFQEATR